MGIDRGEFDYFNSEVIAVLRSSGVVVKDLITIGMALNATKKDIVTA